MALPESETKLKSDESGLLTSFDNQSSLRNILKYMKIIKKITNKKGEELSEIKKNKNLAKMFDVEDKANDKISNQNQRNTNKQRLIKGKNNEIEQKDINKFNMNNNKKETYKIKDFKEKKVGKIKMNIKNINNKKDEKKSISYDNSDDSEMRELDYMQDDESEKSEKIKSSKSAQIQYADLFHSRAKLQHNLSAHNLLQLNIPKLRKKKFYSMSRRQSKSSADIARFKSKMKEVSRFNNPLNDALITDQDYLMKEVEDENDNELDNKSSNIVSLNDESHSVVEPKEEDLNCEDSNNKMKKKRIRVKKRKKKRKVRKRRKKWKKYLKIPQVKLFLKENC